MNNLIYVFITGSFNTASGKYCCNRHKIQQWANCYPVSIPQAVSTVATRKYFLHCFWSHRFNTASGKYCCNCSTKNFARMLCECFNTASGKYCCNHLIAFDIRFYIPYGVSIPQAVSTVATTLMLKCLMNCYLLVSIPQAVSTVATFSQRKCFKTCRVSIPQAVSTVATGQKK